MKIVTNPIEFLHSYNSRLCRAPAVALCLLLASTNCARSSAQSAVHGESSCMQKPGFHDAMKAYFEIGDELAKDGQATVPTNVQSAKESLERLRTRHSCGQDEQRLIQELTDVLRGFQETQSIVDVRRQYGEWSHALVQSLTQMPAVRQNYLVLRCTMTEGHNQWVQSALPLRNPYQGQAMYSCGSQIPWSGTIEERPPSSSQVDSASEPVAHYVCPMHPRVRTNHRSHCPLCGMNLVPVTRDEQMDNGIYIGADARRDAGIQTTPITRGPMHKSIRTLAVVQVDRTRMQDVALRFSGFIEKAWVVDIGTYVQRGDPLFSIYSPELYTAQKEYIEAARSSSTATLSSVTQSARNRLRLAGLTAGQIEELTKRNEPFEAITWFAPASGYVLETHVVQGASVAFGQTLYRIVPLDRVWIEAEIHEQDLPYVQIGTRSHLRPPFARKNEAPSTVLSEVSYLSPNLHPTRRTRTARVVLPSPALTWLPGTSVEMVFHVELGERLHLPKSAVVHTGPRTIVFVDDGQGKIRPREVQVRSANEDVYEVLGGLQENEKVVSAGTFLVSSESRLRDAAPTQLHLAPSKEISPSEPPRGTVPSLGGVAP